MAPLKQRIFSGRQQRFVSSSEVRLVIAIRDLQTEPVACLEEIACRPDFYGEFVGLVWNQGIRLRMGMERAPGF